MGRKREGREGGRVRAKEASTGEGGRKGVKQNALFWLKGWMAFILLIIRCFSYMFLAHSLFPSFGVLHTMLSTACILPESMASQRALYTKR